MTLNTSIYVLGQVDHRRLFVECNKLIGAHEGIRFEDRQDGRWQDGEHIPAPGSPWSIFNEIDQGLCALLDVHYRPDGPLHAGTSHWDDCDPGCDYAPHLQAHWLHVSFDTAYGYRGDNGEGCGDLHARLVAQLGQWLDRQGIGWKWQNEFTGEIHDRYDGLTELRSGGAEASDWFRDIVRPAIVARLAFESPGTATRG
jgi:hypothetical protein